MRTIPRFPHPDSERNAQDTFVEEKEALTRSDRCVDFVIPFWADNANRMFDMPESPYQSPIHQFLMAYF